MILITLVPVSGRPGVYRAEIDGPGVVCTSRQPFYDAARTLLRLGYDPSEPIEARHIGSTLVAMRGTLGEAAKWTISETDAAGLAKRRWQPFDTSRLRNRTCDSSNHGVLENTQEAAE